MNNYDITYLILNVKGGKKMKKLVAILIGVIIILVIALCIITALYLRQRNLIYEYFGNYDFSLNSNTQENTASPSI